MAIGNLNGFRCEGSVGALKEVPQQARPSKRWMRASLLLFVGVRSLRVEEQTSLTTLSWTAMPPEGTQGTDAVAVASRKVAFER